MKHNDQHILVVLIDDHDVFREGLVSQLNAQTDMRVVSDARDLETGIGQVLVHNPDVVIMDLLFPGQDAFAAVRTILARRPETKTNFLTACEQDVYIERALQMKAWGYLTKNDSLNSICEGIREVAKGWVYFSPSIKKRVIHAPDGPKLSSKKTTRLNLLTSRELQLLRHLAEGMSTKEIAQAMSISVKTVDNHKSNLMSKLGIHDRVKLARFAFREGLILP